MLRGPFLHRLFVKVNNINSLMQWETRVCEVEALSYCDVT